MIRKNDIKVEIPLTWLVKWIGRKVKIIFKGK